MNKRGDLAVTIILLIAVFLMVYCLFVFVTFNNRLDAGVADNSETFARSAFSNQYISENSKIIAKQTITSGNEDLKARFMFEANNKEFPLDIAGNYYGKIRSGEFEIYSEGLDYVLELDNVHVTLEGNGLRVKKSFNICYIFNSTGDYQRAC